MRYLIQEWRKGGERPKHGGFSVVFKPTLVRAFEVDDVEVDRYREGGEAQQSARLYFYRIQEVARVSAKA